jgi:hypothetical protein
VQKHFFDISQVIGAFRLQASQRPPEYALSLRLVVLNGALSRTSSKVGWRRPWSSNGFLRLFVLFLTGLNQHFVLLGDELLHVLKGVSHFCGAPHQRYQQFGIPSVSLSVADG